MDFHDMFPTDPKKETITEDMHLEKEWFEQASKIKTIEELTEFVNHMLNDYNHDYGTICHAISACSLAAAWLGTHIDGITGFQASFVMWDFIQNWMYSSNKCGLKIIDYDEFLYPQYVYKYDKIISRENWDMMQKEAKKKLETEDYACEKVRKHWQRIVDGVVPFGYRVVDD